VSIVVSKLHTSTMKVAIAFIILRLIVAVVSVNFEKTSDLDTAAQYLYPYNGYGGYGGQSYNGYGGYHHGYGAYHGGYENRHPHHHYNMYPPFRGGLLNLGLELLG